MDQDTDAETVLLAEIAELKAQRAQSLRLKKQLFDAENRLAVLRATAFVVVASRLEVVMYGVSPEATPRVANLMVFLRDADTVMIRGKRENFAFSLKVGGTERDLEQVDKKHGTIQYVLRAFRTVQEATAWAVVESTV